jgi:hypothetical protein
MQFARSIFLGLIASTVGTGLCQTPATNTASSTPTRAQVDRLLTLMHTGDAQTPLMHEQLEKQRATLPAWFPAAVWDDVERQVEGIHYADACLAVYQKYMTADQVETMASVFEGPTGQQIADVMSGRAEKAVRAGHEGYDADEQVGKAMQADQTIPALMAKRFGEMPLDQRVKVQSQLPAIREVMKPVEDGCQSAYNARATEVAHTTMAKHNAEIQAAQRAFHPAN